MKTCVPQTRNTLFPRQQPHGCYSQWIHVYATSKNYILCPSHQVHVMPQPADVQEQVMPPANNYMDATGKEYRYATDNETHVMPQPTNKWYTTANNYMNATAKINTCIYSLQVLCHSQLPHVCHRNKKVHAWPTNTCYATANYYYCCKTTHVCYHQEIHVMPHPTTTWMLQPK